MRGLAAWLSGLALGGLVLAAGPALAQSKKIAPGSGAVGTGQSDVDRVIAALREVGYDGTLDQSVTPPKVVAEIDGAATDIELLNCEEGTLNGCAIMRLHAGFDLPDPVDLKKVNDWNRKWYFGRAYVDDNNDAHIDIVVSLVGVDDRNLVDLVEVWEIVTTDFLVHVSS